MNEKLIFADAVLACNQSIHPYCEGCNFNVSGKTEEDLIEEYGQFDAVATSDDFVCPIDGLPKKAKLYLYLYKAIYRNPNLYS